MRQFALVLALCCMPAVGQKIFVYPTGPVAPRGSYQTVTAVVTGVNDKTVSWATTGGTLVGAEKCTRNEPCTVALYSTNPGTFTVTATSNANRSIMAESKITITNSPAPVTGHPRLIVTEAMLPALRAKATAKNVVYEAIRDRAISVLNTDNEIWSWSCNGGTGLPSSAQESGKENDAYLFAFMSLIDPSDSKYKWGCYGRDLWTYVMGEVISGKEFFGGNQWSDGSVPFAVTTDWLMGGGFLTPADKTLARKFLYVAAQKSFHNNGYIPPAKGYNSAAQFNTGDPYELVSMRAMGNNYTMSRVLYMVAIGLTFNDDPADDPPLENTCKATRYDICPDFTAGSLRAYFRYAVGSMLYLDWAHLEDPDVTWRAYHSAFHNLDKEPTCVYVDGSKHLCFGDGRGGESAEGSWYQYSMYRLRYALNILHSAGVDDPIVYGPQISLGTSSWWDLKYVSDIEFLTGPMTQTGDRPSAYNYLTTGDSNWYYRSLGDFTAESAMLTADSYTSRTDRTGALKWLLLNAAPGGPVGRNGRCNGTCGFDASLGAESAGWPAAPVAFDWLISQPASDPTSSLPPDPRPSLPLDLYNGSFNQHVMLRNSWGPNSTLFSAYCPNAMIDHDHEYCGRFDIFANGEYITKGRTEFTDYNDWMTTAPASNAAAYLNVTGKDCKDPQCTQGGQFYRAIEAGLNTFHHSELAEYAAAIADSTNDYNGVWVYASPYDVPGYNDVKSASRSLIYLRRSNQVIFYDRGTTGHAAGKAVYQITTGTASISGKTASWMTRSNSQKAYLTTVLPADAAPAIAPLPVHTVTSAPYASLQIGTTMQASCTVVNADNSKTDCTSTAIWESDNPAIATVTSKGEITAKALGSTGIHASGSGFGNSATLTVVSTGSGGTWSVDYDKRQIEDWEPASSIKVDAGAVTSAHFLNVLEFGPASLNRTETSAVQSTSGQPFDGARVGSNLVMFMRTWPGAFTGTTYPASGGTTQYISDLTPNTAYAISGDGAPESATTDTAGVLVFKAAGTGSIGVRPQPGTTAPKPTRSSHIGIGTAATGVAAVSGICAVLARVVISSRSRAADQ